MIIIITYYSNDKNALKMESKEWKKVLYEWISSNTSIHLNSTTIIVREHVTVLKCILFASQFKEDSFIWHVNHFHKFLTNGMCV